MSERPATFATKSHEAAFPSLDELPIMVAFVDGEEICRYANRAFADDLGLAPEEIVGSRLPDHWDTEAYPRIKHYAARAMQGESVVFTYESRRHRQARSLRARFAPHRQKGVVQGFIALIEEVTAQTGEYGAVSDTAAFFRDITASIPGVVFQYQQSGDARPGHFTYLSPQLEQWVALDREQLMVDPGSMRSFVHPDDLDGLRRSIARAAKRCRPWSWRGRIRAEDGRHIYTQGIAQPHRDPNGNVVWNGILLDVSEQKQVERVLKETAAFFHDIATTIPGIVYRFAQARDGARRFEYVSPQLSEITGLSAQDVIADANVLLDRIHPDDRPDFEQSIARSAESLRAWMWEGRLCGKHGRTIWLRGASLPRRQRDGCIVWNGVVLDITDSKATEDKLREAHKMEAVGQLTGGLAHDFNNLLAVISGNLELLEERLDEQPRLAAMVSKARQAAARGSDVTQRLLAFARRQPLSPRVVDINELVGRTAELLEHALGPDIEIATAPLAARRPVQVDPGELENALINLAMNARDAMPDGGVVTIETGDLRLDPHDATGRPPIEPGSYAVVAVTDTGVGMSRATVDKAFEPFFSTKAADKGTGLGLSMVYGFVTQSGGHVSVDSAEGAGTTVRLYLPHTDTAQAPAAGPEETPAASHARAGEVALVVEDEPDLRASMGTMLEAAGYTLITVEDATAALAELEKAERVDLLLTDVILGHGDEGRRLARRARRMRDPAILFVSGFAGDAAGDDLAALSDAPLLKKPFRKRELLRRARAAIDAARVRRGD